MTIKILLKVFAALLMSALTFNTNAASISFDTGVYVVNSAGQISVTVNYDFTDDPAFGGGFNVIYDPTNLEFMSYTQAIFTGPGGGPQNQASPLGNLVAPGQYLGAGVGTFEFFTGINTAGPVGTFVFRVLSSNGDGGCGLTLCLTPVDTNPMFNLLGQEITDEVFANGISAATIVPVPAAVWFMLSGLGALFGFSRKSV